MYIENFIQRWDDVWNDVAINNITKEFQEFLNDCDLPQYSADELLLINSKNIRDENKTTEG